MNLELKEGEGITPGTPRASQTSVGTIWSVAVIVFLALRKERKKDRRLRGMKILELCKCHIECCNSVMPQGVQFTANDYN